MIVENELQLTEAVLAETERADDPRFREIVQALVRHLHDFARDVRLTEAEFDSALTIVARLGQPTTAGHDEVRLMAGSLGLSTLVTLVNNGTEEPRARRCSSPAPYGTSTAARSPAHPVTAKSATRPEV